MSEKYSSARCACRGRYSQRRLGGWLRVLINLFCLAHQPSLLKLHRCQIAKTTVRSVVVVVANKLRHVLAGLLSCQLSGWHELSEVITTFIAWAWVLLTVFQPLPWVLPLSSLTCMMLANLLNGWRTLHAHAYISTGQATDALGQLRDSTTFQLPAWLGELVAPVGQRFHAAHHLFPYLPYHALAEANRRLRGSNWVHREAYLHTLR